MTWVTVIRNGDDGEAKTSRVLPITCKSVTAHGTGVPVTGVAQNEERKDQMSETKRNGPPSGKLDYAHGDVALVPDLIRSGSASAALLIEGLLPGDVDGDRANAVHTALSDRAARLRRGDTADIEDDLAGQLAWLTALIAYAERKAIADGVTPQAADVWFRLALRAQTNYARTVAAFAAVQLAKPRLPTS